ncbi:hypothetical protein L6R49_28565, partial [Myxococcota bacterium]|nr:hypothetical protein [Myxococcota bacterium]
MRARPVLLTSALVLGLLSLPALGIDPALIAPRAPELEEALRGQRALLEEVSALEVAASRVHNRWAERGLNEGKGAACADEIALSLGARARGLGAELGRRVQRARVGQGRVEAMSASQTVLPLLDAARRDELRTLRERVDRHARVYLELSAWQTLYVEPRLKGCAAELAVSAGLALTGPDGELVETEAVAALVVDAGVVCPGASQVTPGVVVIRGPGCWSPGPGCACEPDVLQPAAVLGEAPPLPPP